MTVPICAISIIFICIYLGIVVFFLGITFYILTENNLGIFSENPLFWSIIFALGSPITYLFVNTFIMDIITHKDHNGHKQGVWMLPKLLNNNVQECYVRTLNSIWGTDDGIRGKMFKNWIKFT